MCPRIGGSRNRASSRRADPKLRRAQFLSRVRLLYVRAGSDSETSKGELVNHGNPFRTAMCLRPNQSVLTAFRMRPSPAETSPKYRMLKSDVVIAVRSAVSRLEDQAGRQIGRVMAQET